MATKTEAPPNGAVETAVSRQVVEIAVGTDLDQAPTTLYATLVGLTPVLQNRPSLLQAAGKEVQKTNSKRIPTPEEEATAGCYRNDVGHLYAPSTWIQRAVVEAGKAFKHPRNPRASAMKLVAAAILPPAVEGFVFQRDGEPITEYEIDIQRAVVQRAAVMRARPRIDTPWTLDIALDFDVEALVGNRSRDPENLTQAGSFLASMFTQAGRAGGLGDYRPERGGPYGRFSVESFRVEG